MNKDHTKTFAKIEKGFKEDNKKKFGEGDSDKAKLKKTLADVADVAKQELASGNT